MLNGIVSNRKMRYGSAMTSDGVDVSIGARFRQIRTELDLSQAAMCSRLFTEGVPWSQGTLSKVENGERPIRLAEAPLVARALGVELDELLSGKSRLNVALRRLDVAVDESRKRLRSAEEEFTFHKKRTLVLRLIKELGEGGAGPYEVVNGDVDLLLSMAMTSGSVTGAGLSIDDVILSLGLDRTADFAGVETDLARMIADPTAIPDYLDANELGVERMVLDPDGARDVLTEAKLKEIFAKRFPQLSFQWVARSGSPGLDPNGVQIVGIVEAENA